VTPLRVAIGVVAGIVGGPSTYGVELARALARLSAQGRGRIPLEIVVLTDRPELFAGEDGVRTVALPLGSSWGQPWWDNVRIPSALAAYAPDVYHGTKHALPLRGVPARTAGVVTIHDLAVLSEPETFSRAQRWHLLVHLKHAARRATRIVCDSRHAADDVGGRLAVDRSRIAVVPLGVDGSFRPPADDAARAAVRRRLGLAGGALVAFVGTIQPRKHIEVAIEAVGLLRARGHEVRLAIAGRRRPGYAPGWLAAPPPFVRLLGELPAATLVELYGAADAMVSPSTYEGFGLTFAEAMACGCPVVGVAASSVPEVVGAGGLLVPRAEALPVADALERLLVDEGLRRTTGLAGRARAAELTWDRCAAATLEVYADAAAARGARPSPAGTGP
jgi:glycosyltransferase involved in cell wall biosynthesis